MSEHGASAKNWSSQWSWASRAREYDVYMSRIDLEEQTRYRRRMNARHRQLGAVAQGKVVAWLNSLTDADVVAMSPADATRLLATAVQIERAATSDAGLDNMPDWVYDEPAREGSLKERLIEAGLDVELSDIARLLHKVLPASEPELPPRSSPSPPRRAPTVEPEPDVTVDEVPPGIWGTQPSPFDTGHGRYGGVA